VGQALSYIIPGVPFGCTVALMAIGIVLTYRATGVFNFAFGAQAYVAALVYAQLTEHSVPRGIAGVLAIAVLSPVIGIICDRIVFSRIATGNVAAKTIAALGLMVGLPALATLVFGPGNPSSPPSLLFNVNDVVFRIDGVAIDGVQLSTVLVTIAVLAILTTTLRWTPIGLEMRAAVESPRLLRLQGVNSGFVSAVAWSVSSGLAGLAGVLLAPRFASVSVDNYTFLLVAAIAAAAVAGLRSMVGAFGIAVAIGIAISVATGYAASGSIWSTGLFAGIPFFVLMLDLAFDPRMRHLDVSADPLSQADPPPALTQLPPPLRVVDRSLLVTRIVVVVAILVSMVTWVPSNWVFALTSGLALSLVFLSITLMTGAAGQVSLCQATFAGVGAFTAGQLALNSNVPILVGALVGALVAAGAGVLAALPALRLRGLALSLSTLTFALLADGIVFPTSWVSGSVGGLVIPRPQIGSISFATDSTKSFFILIAIIVAVVAFVVRLLLRGMTGRSLDATRQSALASAGIGYNLSVAKIMLFGISAIVAGIGGALYGSVLQVVSPADFTYQASLLFVIIVVTVGCRTVSGAIGAGLVYAALSQLLSYLPNRLAPTSIVALAFAFGAFRYARHPQGILEDGRRSVLRVAHLLRNARPAPRAAELVAEKVS
jgi:ABC-type branched-subunit amino acid transport system permease subunit